MYVDKRYKSKKKTHTYVYIYICVCVCVYVYISTIIQKSEGDKVNYVINLSYSLCSGMISLYGRLQ